jgi:hypothetical protein
MKRLCELGAPGLALLILAACAPVEPEDTSEANVVAEAPVAAEAEAPPEDMTPEEVLRRMSSYLVSMDGFQLTARIESDDIQASGVKVEYEAGLELAFARPDRLRVDYRDDDYRKTVWISDGEATLFDKNHGVYSTAPAEGDVLATLDVLSERYGVSVPLDDLLASDPFERLSAAIVKRKYLGVHQAGGVACHHAIFDRGDMIWQIWVEAGDTPRLRKLVITETDEPTAPRYSIEIESLKAGAPDDAAFRVEMPEDAALVPFHEVTIEEKP